jgi:aldose 1-epimerase
MHPDTRTFGLVSTLALLALGASAAPADLLKRLEVSDFGKLPNGTSIKQYTLRNTNGMIAKIITYGAIITELDVPDRQGALTNVVLGAATLDQYLKGFRAPAAIMGRVANRTANASFTLDGVEYKLSANNGRHHLHGTFDKAVWNAGAFEHVADTSATIGLRYISKDGEEGYPGTLSVSVIYTLSDANSLSLEYQATSTKPTPVNLTSHAYFNLAGYGDVLNHELMLRPSRYTVTDGDQIPTGEIASVKGTPLDFTTLTSVGARIDQEKKTGGYDHNFVVDGFESGTNAAPKYGQRFASGVFIKAEDQKPLRFVARVVEPTSGRILDVQTTEPGVQLYTGNHLKHGGLCLETQHFPDSLHHPQFPSIILRPNETFKSMTVFSFSAK